MPKFKSRRYLPNTAWVRDSHIGKMSGCLINDPNLSALNKRSVSVGVAVGLFSACMPIPGQMVLAVMLAIALRGTLALAIAVTWVSNPLTFAPIFYFAYTLGCWLLDSPETAFEIQLSVAWLRQGLTDIYHPLLTGCLVMGVTIASIAHTAIYAGWRLVLRRRWLKRRSLRLNRLADEESALLVE